MHAKLLGLFALSTAVNLAAADDYITFYTDAGCAGGRSGSDDYSVANHGCFSNGGVSASLHGGTAYCSVTLGVYSDNSCTDQVTQMTLREESASSGNQPCSGVPSGNYDHSFKVIQSDC